MNFELIQIQTTGTCNARCAMCPYKNSWFIDNYGIMKEELFDKIINQIDKNYSSKICPYLMNEPFADPYMIRRIEKLKKRFKKATIEVSTNAELLDDYKIKGIVDLLDSNDKIIISHHGIDKETLENTMKIKYFKTINNIIHLIRKLNGKIPIAIQTMAYSKDNKYRYFNTRKVKRYWNKIFYESNLSWNNVWLSTLEFHNRAGNVKIDGWDYNKKVRDIGPDNLFYCPKFDKSLNVLWNGETVLCCMDYMHETPYGDLNTQTIEEIFDSDKYHKTIDICSGKVESSDDMICKRCQTGK